MEHSEPENILGVFIDEAREIVVQLGEQLDELHYGYDGQRILDDIHRGFHTLKGGAAVIGGLEPLVECSSLCEQVLDCLRTKRVALNPGLVSLVMRALNAMESMLDEAGRGEGMRPLPDELRQRLIKAAGREPESAEQGAEFSDLPSSLSGRSGEQSADPLNLFFGANAGTKRDSNPPAEGGAGITDEEFESLLDELHGEGRGPTRLPGEAAAPAAGEETPEERRARTTQSEKGNRAEQIRNLVTELSWVRSRLMRLSSLRSREDLSKALSYLDLVTRDMERWVRELDE